MDPNTMKPAAESDLELQELISWVISSISHELRTPLTTILASAELLEYYQDQWSDEQKIQYLKQIKISSLAIRSILDSEDFSANLQKLADQILEPERVYQLCQILRKDNE
jgi:K+-sensing histidine kinase KdpD